MTRRDPKQATVKLDLMVESLRWYLISSTSHQIKVSFSRASFHEQEKLHPVNYLNRNRALSGAGKERDMVGVIKLRL